MIEINVLATYETENQHQPEEEIDLELEGVDQSETKKEVKSVTVSVNSDMIIMVQPFDDENGGSLVFLTNGIVVRAEETRSRIHNMDKRQ